MKKQTLLEKAKSVPIGKRPTRGIYDDDERMELALAWLVGDIRIGQVTKALNSTGGTSGYAHVAMGLGRAYEQGLLKVKSPIINQDQE